MKVFLMHRSRDVDLQQSLPAHRETLTQDLELDTILTSMAGGDPFLYEVANRTMLLSLSEPDAIIYRQQVLADCLDNPSVARDLYALAGAAIRAEKSVWGGWFTDSSKARLHRCVEVMELLVGFLKRLRATADAHSDDFRSEGFARFFSMLAEELDDEYFHVLDRHLTELKFTGGTLLSAQLGAGNRGRNYRLRQSRGQPWLKRVFDRSSYSFTIPARDDSGFRALGELEDRGLNVVANALAQSTDHVVSLFVMLRTEIGFYVACLNLREQLVAAGTPTAFPVVLGRDQVSLSAHGLCDVALALTVKQPVVGNDISADHKSLILITGANQGGKSTFMRSVGLAQLMTQCGMFVTAESFRANICDGIFTHHKREEDATMRSGKLDEELARMSDIADHIATHGMLLCNESFASTNEREGSEIARQIILALLDEGIKLLFVTHMFDLAHGFHTRGSDDALFLRAERGPGGARPFKLVEGEPLPTSYGEDSYRQIFGTGHQ
jgi:hypothetical protein